MTDLTTDKAGAEPMATPQTVLQPMVAQRSAARKIAGVKETDAAKTSRIPIKIIP